MTEVCRRDSSCYVRPGGVGPGMVGPLQGGLQLQDDELSASQSYPALELPARWGGSFLCLGCRPSQSSPVGESVRPPMWEEAGLVPVGTARLGVCDPALYRHLSLLLLMLRVTTLALVSGLGRSLVSLCPETFLLLTWLCFFPRLLPVSAVGLRAFCVKWNRTHCPSFSKREGV